MSSKSIFTQTHAPQSSRLVDGYDSAVYSNLAIGKVNGLYRTLPALMSRLATDEDSWKVVNIRAQGSNGLNIYDAVAVLGAISDEQATDWVLQQHGQFFDAVVTDVQQTSYQGLMRHLANRQLHAYQAPIRFNDLAAMQDVTTGQPVHWDGIELASHSGQMGVMLVDMIKHDDHSLLLDALTRDGLGEILAELGAEFAEYDALIVEKHNLPRLMSRLSTAMAKATEAGASISKVTQTEPFKKNKVTQIAVLFEMSDGQSVAIVFHNPDSTPSKLLPQDTLISWKWLLNKRDVSAAVQPNQGEDVQLPVLATRIMRLVNQNSARFKRQQAARVKTQQELEAARQRLGEQVEQIAALDGEMAEIQKQIDEPAPNPIENTAVDPEYTSEQLATPDVYTTISQSDEQKTRYQAFYHTFFEARIAAVRDALRQLGWAEQGNDADISKNGVYASFSFELVEGTNHITGFTVNGIRDDLTQSPEELAAALDDTAKPTNTADYEFLESVKAGTVSALDPENFARVQSITLDAKSDGDEETEDKAMRAAIVMADKIIPLATEKGIDTERLYTAVADKDPLEILDAIEALQAALVAEPAVNSDQEFLQKIIDGTVEATTVDMDFIIELAEKHQADEVMNALVGQALDVINKAEQLAAQAIV